MADNEIACCERFTPEAVEVFVGDNPNYQVLRHHIHDLFYSGDQHDPRQPGPGGRSRSGTCSQTRQACGEEAFAALADNFTAGIQAMSEVVIGEALGPRRHQR